MYETPSSDTIRKFLRDNGLTGSKVAAIVGVDSRTVRKWTASEDADTRRAMPWSAWALLRLYVGELSIETYRKEIFIEHGFLNK